MILAVMTAILIVYDHRNIRKSAVILWDPNTNAVVIILFVFVLCSGRNRGCYMPAIGYEFYLRVVNFI